MWYASFPAFGDWHINLFRRFGADTVRAALNRLHPDQRPALMFHTDQFGFADDLNLPAKIGYSVVGSGSGLDVMNTAHREVMRAAQPGDWISCLQADFVLSGNFFERIHEHMSGGAHAIVAFGTRARADVPKVPIGEDPRSLLLWAWTNRHDIVKQLQMWPGHPEDNGNGGMPGHVFFLAGHDDVSVVVHSIHVHPLCFLNNGKVNVDFTHEVGSSTTLQAFDPSTIHMVTDPDDVSYCDLLELDRTQPLLDRPLAGGDVSTYLKGWNTPLNRWQFAQRICLVGSPQKVNEQDDVDQIMSHW